MVTIKSKLPKVGPTIFSQMSALAAKYQAINLSQGFPDFDGADYLKQQACKYIREGANQYAPMTGVPALNQTISNKVDQLYQAQVSAEKEVTITSGATEAIFAAVHAVINPGDEVIVFDPAYDSYEPTVELAGGHCLHLPLRKPNFSINWSLLADSINQKTRMIIVNSPHNPSGSVLSSVDLEQLWQLIGDKDILLISDEVYEHIVFDGHVHASVLTHPQLAQRCFVISSFGKTYHMTGWRVGYCIAPARLSMEFRKVHQFLTFSTTTPIQYALAEMLAKHPEHTVELPLFYQKKRDFFARILADTRFKLFPCQGTYFQLVDYSAISDLNDVEFCLQLAKEAGVVGIPLSPFYHVSPPNQRIIRFCFAKGERTLKEAGRRLCRM